MRITAKTTDRLALIRELRRITGETPKVCLSLADTMLIGGSIELANVKDKEDTNILTVERPVVEDCWTRRRRECDAANALIAAGAAGDVNAAIEVCKKIQTGELNFLFSAWG